MFEVGQEVWDVIFGKGEVVAYDEESDSAYPVKVRFKNGRVETYTEKGKALKDCKRSLFFSEPTVTAELYPTKKHSMLKVCDLIVVKDKRCSEAVVVSFLKEDEDRIHYVYDDGQKDYSYKKNVSVYLLDEEIEFR